MTDKLRGRRGFGGRQKLEVRGPGFSGMKAAAMLYAQEVFPRFWS